MAWRPCGFTGATARPLTWSAASALSLAPVKGTCPEHALRTGALWAPCTSSERPEGCAQPGAGSEAGLRAVCSVRLPYKPPPSTVACDG